MGRMGRMGRKKLVGTSGAAYLLGWNDALKKL